MPYNEALAEKVRLALGETKGLTEKQMFGGIAFLVDGAMCVGVDKDDLIVRRRAWIFFWGTCRGQDRSGVSC